MPASRTCTRVRVHAPGPLASCLAGFGERLTLLGRTRIETVEETQLETQVARSWPGQFMTLTSTAADLDIPPQQCATRPAGIPGPPTSCQPTPTSRAPSPSPQMPQGPGHFGRGD
jgi:hypothetical protein